MLVITFTSGVETLHADEEVDESVVAYETLTKKFEANRQQRKFVSKFIEIADKFPGQAGALSSLEWVLRYFRAGKECDLALTRLTKQHASSADLPSVFSRIGHNPSLEVGRFYEAVIKANPHPHVQGEARYRLALYLTRQNQIAREIRAQPEKRDRYDLFYGKELTDHLVTNDLTQSRLRAIEMLNEINNRYGEIKVFKGTLSDLATKELFHIEHLSVGGTVPEIIGEDIDGEQFKLSDFRGKIVMIDFWADWCVACRAMYSFNRQLVQDMQGRPFVLVGINSDRNRQQTKKVVATQRLTWRSWWNGGSTRGPISTRWGVETWPVIYVVDENGLIHHKNIKGASLRQAIEELVSDLEASQSAKSD